MEPVSNAILTKAAVELSKLLWDWASKPRPEVAIEVQRSEAAIRQHLSFTNAWAGKISFRDLWRSKDLLESFVDLDLHLGPMRPPSDAEDKRGLRVSSLASLKGNIVLLGDPGAGKTTSLKRLALALLSSDSSPPALPIVIRLRELEGESHLLDHLTAALGLSWRITPGTDVGAPELFRQRLVVEALEVLNATLLLDGLDELEPQLRRRTARDVETLLLNATGFRVVLTCRTAEFPYDLRNCSVYTLYPLNEGQIRQFALRWLGTQRARRFLEEVRRSPYSGTEVLPLSLAHLCALYEQTGEVPEQPRTVYGRLVDLLVSHWDEQRSVSRASRFPGFTKARKRGFLRAVAFQLLQQGSSAVIELSDIESGYELLYERFEVPRFELPSVLREIEAHTGLLFETTTGRYEFIHKAIQEYLAAEYVVAAAEVPVVALSRAPNEAAIAVALASSPGEYLLSILGAVSYMPDSQLARFATALLRRLKLERPDFAPTLELGWAVLLLYSEALFSGPQCNRRVDRDFEIAFRDFMSRRAVRDGVVRALEGAAVHAGGGSDTEPIQLVPSRRQIVRSFLQNRAWGGRGVVLDRSLLQLVDPVDGGTWQVQHDASRGKVLKLAKK